MVHRAPPETVSKPPIMILPDNRDELLEWAAARIEELSILDWPSLPQRNKGERRNSKRLRRAEEDAELTKKVIAVTRAKCAAELRRLLNRPDLAALAVLDRLERLPDDRRHDVELRDAWPLSFLGKGWLTIACTIRCDGDSIPPETRYRIELTDKGREILAQYRNRQQPPVSATGGRGCD